MYVRDLRQRAASEQGTGAGKGSRVRQPTNVSAIPTHRQASESGHDFFTDVRGWQNTRHFLSEPIKIHCRINVNSFI